MAKKERWRKEGDRGRVEKGREKGSEGDRGKCMMEKGRDRTVGKGIDGRREKIEGERIKCPYIYIFCHLADAPIQSAFILRLIGGCPT